jgi:hypothetical protein
MNYFDEDNATEFRDEPDEVQGMDAEPVSVRSAPVPQAPKPQVPQQAVSVKEEQYEETSQEETTEEEDISVVLSDARLRLEQGKLYELVLQNDLFVDTGIDERAVKHVQKEIRKFAQERMEIMLGMRQETTALPNAFPAEGFPFNALEVEVLKALAATATGGVSRESDAYVPEIATPAPRKASLSPIKVGGQRPAAPQKAAPKPQAKKPLPPAPAVPVRRKNIDAAVQRILEEEGVSMEELNRTFPPDYQPLSADYTEKLTPEQISERNRDAARRTQKQAKSQSALPMPNQEQINSIYASRVNTEEPNILMKTIMSELSKRK